ncbi:MAG: cytidylate kinase-like family protein [Armatimonadota bacterium]|nr:cytidylate kinase-like family protein [Armatimonadota bacterium]MCX7778132.1 cytidylate kinase-like family protein [Armatimonadota bacterium]MDW8024844.1 cytidylate kinase-like family protein [Armatimonadota bacterium]
MAVITVSRVHGCNGELIARGVADFLGYEFVDREVIKHVAEIVNLPEKEVEKFDEVHMNPLLRFIYALLRHGGRCADVHWTPGIIKHLSEMLSAEWVGAAPQYSSFDHEAYVDLIKQLIERLYIRGSVVIVGRGGMVILRDKPRAFHVRLTAPLQWRVENLSSSMGIPKEQAKNEILKCDRKRSLYLRQFYGVDWNDASLYHIVVNVASVGVERAPSVIVNAFLQWMR